MSRDLAALDADLARWTETAARIGRTLETVTQTSAYLRLKAQSRLGGLTGLSKSRAAAAIAATDRLWSLYLVLDKVLTEAADLRRSKNPFGADERYGKIENLLGGPAVLLPTEEPTLSHLRLGGDPDRRLTLADVVAAMDRAFEDVRDTVAAAEAGWSSETRFDVMRERAARLAAEAEALGYGRLTALEEVDRLIDEAAKVCQTDPLASHEAAVEVDTRLASADRSLTAARTDRRETERCLGEAERRLDQLSEWIARTAATRAERLAQVVDPLPDHALPADPLPDLRQWLDRLQRTAAEGRAKAAFVGAKSWNARVAALEATLQSSIDGDRRVLEARQDLRGRFSAVKAKAEGLARQNRLDPAAADLIGQTRTLLFGQPTPLPRAVQMMRRCERI